MKIAKAVVAAVGATVSVLTLVLGDDIFDMTDIGKLVTILIEQGLMVFAVFQVRNKDS